MNSTVSIIITNYNKAPYLKEAIDSALRQSRKADEILIIDDGSTDNSLAIINQYINTPNVKIVTQENQGIIAVRNKAIKQAKGDLILQLDGDDLLHKDYLKLTVPHLDQSNNIGIAYCQTEFIGNKSGKWDLGKFSLRKQLTSNQIVITALFRKVDFMKTPGYRNQFSEGLEDWDLWLSILSLGREVKQIDSIGFYYRILSNSRNVSYSKEKETNIKKNISTLHWKLYIENGVDPVNLLWEQEVLKNEIYDLKVFKNSMEYKLGSLLLKPLRVLQKLIPK